ncbi:MAG: hypothetical protein HY718_18170, partial [Planctomycetes bacterium]|nr:hypothetical protein [Planctomycetota bacterium]
DLTIISSAGGLAVTGGIVNVTPRAGFGVGEYPLLDYTTSFTGSAGNLTIGSVPGGFVYAFVNNPGTTSINLVVAAPGDHDQDGDVDQEDFGYFQACLQGPGWTTTDPACLWARLDPDEDIDMDDYAVFEACHSGANVQADAPCGP